MDNKITIIIIYVYLQKVQSIDLLQKLSSTLLPYNFSLSPFEISMYSTFYESSQTNVWTSSTHMKRASTEIETFCNR